MKLFLISVIMSITLGLAYSQEPTTHIRLNQIGFLPLTQKIAAIVETDAETFFIQNELGQTIYSGTLGNAATWASSGESVKIADFSAVTKPGTYTLSVPQYGTSHPFTISDSVFDEINNAIVKAFYFNRASTELLPQHAGKYARKAGHMDTEVIILPSAAGPKRKAGDIISAPKGWYDAGDYNKYIVNSNISVGTLLLAYENYSEYFDTLTWNIPESSSPHADLLEEIRWNLDWMLTMQDPDDGGVYNKTTESRFCTTLMPHEVKAPRYVVAKGTAATFGFAAVMAMSYRIYKKIDPEFAETCLKAAEYAWTWAQKNPDIPYVNPRAEQGYPAVTTGGYGDNYFDDEKTWAASELLIATKNDKKYAPHINLQAQFDVPDWRHVGMLGLYSLHNHRAHIQEFVDTNLVQYHILSKAKELQTIQFHENPYQVVAIDFSWGSNGIMANQAILFLYAYNITKNYHFFNAALSCYDYILGRNATEYCFVTGFGGKYSDNVHHRTSGADKIKGSVPGFVAGGPNGGNKRDCFGNYSRFAAKAYVDAYCSFTTNEVAINWQAPLTYVAHAIKSEYTRWKQTLKNTYGICHPQSVLFSQQETSSEITILSNSSWKIAHNNSWFSIETTEGDGNANIQIQCVEQNKADTNRIGYFDIHTNNEFSQRVYITQKGKLTKFRIEAESFIAMYGVQTENTTDTSGGTNVGWIHNDDFMEYEINFPYTGTYKLMYRVACFDNIGSLYVSEHDTVYSHIEIDPTGGWQSWVTITDTAFFTEGTHIIKLNVLEGGFNLNYIDFHFLSEENTHANKKLSDFLKEQETIEYKE